MYAPNRQDRDQAGAVHQSLLTQLLGALKISEPLTPLPPQYDHARFVPIIKKSYGGDESEGRWRVDSGVHSRIQIVCVVSSEHALAERKPQMHERPGTSIGVNA